MNERIDPQEFYEQAFREAVKPLRARKKKAHAKLLGALLCGVALLWWWPFGTVWEFASGLLACGWMISLLGIEVRFGFLEAEIHVHGPTPTV